MNILVLGGAGFFGKNLCLELIKNPIYSSVTFVDLVPVTELPDWMRALLKVRKFHYVSGELLNQDFVNKLVVGQHFIINLAAQTSHVLPISDPIANAQNNIMSNLRVLEAVRHHNPEAKLIYVSTSSVIGRSTEDKITENHIAKPLDFYSITKLTAESYCFGYFQNFGIKVMNLRFPNLFGPFGHDKPDFGFINYFICQAFANKPIKIFGNGQQQRNALYIKDAIHCLDLCVNFDELFNGETYFAGSAEHHSVKEIAETIGSLFNCPSVEFVPWPKDRKAIEVGDVYISSAKLHNLTGWKPEHSLQDALKGTFELLCEYKRKQS